jgi:hypothetical protein
MTPDLKNYLLFLAAIGIVILAVAVIIHFNNQDKE